jgi:hypothetical protein
MSLHREDDHVLRAHSIVVVRGRYGRMLLAAIRIDQAQSARAQGFEIGAARDARNGLTGQRQSNCHIPADRADADDRYFHVLDIFMG